MGLNQRLPFKQPNLPPSIFRGGAPTYYVVNNNVDNLQAPEGPYPSYDIAASVGRYCSLMAAQEASRRELSETYRKYLAESRNTLAHQFENWVSDAIWEREPEHLTRDLRDVDPRFLRRNAKAAARYLAAGPGGELHPYHARLVTLYLFLHYPREDTFADDARAMLEPFHRARAIRRLAASPLAAQRCGFEVVQNADVSRAQSPSGTWMTISQDDATRILRRLFSWHRGTDYEVLETNLMQPGRWEEFCYRSVILPGLRVSELAHAAQALIRKADLQHGVDLSDRHETGVLRQNLLHITQWAVASEKGLL